MNLKNYSQVHHLTAIAFILALALVPSAHPANIWDGSGADGFWNTANNWDNDTVPAASQNLTFSGNVQTITTNNISAGFSVGTITFANDSTNATSGFTLAGLNIALGADIGTAASSSIITDTISSNLQMTGNRGVNTGANHNLIISGVISQSSGTRSFTKAGTGELTLQNASNTYLGATTINAGTLTVNVAGGIANAGVASALGSGTVANSLIRFSGGTLNVTLGAGGTDRQVQIGSTNVANSAGANINNNSVNGGTPLVFSNTAFNVSAGATTITANRLLTLGGANTDANAINGVISDNNTAGGGTISLTKSGSGRWVLSGVNTYTGATSVSGGTLLVSNGGSIAQSSLTTVTTGTTLTANGTVGAVAVNTGGTLNGAGTVGTTTVAGTLTPGNSPGVLNVNGNLTMASGGNMVWELFANTATQASPAVFDQVLVSGNLTFDGSNGISLNFGTTAAGSTVSWSDSFWSSNRSFLIYDVSGSTTGFSNLSLLNTSFNDATGAALAESQGNFTVSQLGSDVFLNYNAIPEPSTGTLLGFGFGGLVLTRLLRRKQS